MTWNHRVCKETYKKGQEGEWVHYSIREVFYNPDKEPMTCSAEPETPQEETVEDLIHSLKWFLQATEQPILDLDTIVWASMEEEQ